MRCTSGPVVGTEGVVAARPWRDVEHRAVSRVEQRTPFEHLLETRKVLGTATIRYARRGARVMVELVLPAVTLHRAAVALLERERRHRAPLRAQELRRCTWKEIARLIDENLESERLPAVEIDEFVGLELRREQGRVQRFVDTVGVVLDFVRTVSETEGDPGLGDPVPESARGIARCRAIFGVVTLGFEDEPVTLFGFQGRHRVLEAPLEHPVGRVADRFVARRSDVRRLQLLVMQVVVGHRVVGRPGVVHCPRDVEEVARVHGRARQITSNRLQGEVVPEPGDAGLAQGRSRREGEQGTKQQAVRGQARRAGKDDRHAKAPTAEGRSGFDNNYKN